MLREVIQRHPYLFLLWLSGLFLSVCLLLGGIWMHQKSVKEAAYVPRHIVQDVPFPVYHIKNMPPAYKTDEASYSYRNDILSFKLVRSDKKTVLITQQAVPANVDAEKMVLERLRNTTAIMTPYGKAIIGTQDKTRGASLVSDQTWIFISAPNTITSDDLAAIMRSMRLQPE